MGERNQVMPIFLRSPLWLLLLLVELFKWTIDWRYSGDAAFNLYLAIFIILRRIEWEIGEKKINIPWFTSNN